MKTGNTTKGSLTAAAVAALIAVSGSGAMADDSEKKAEGPKELAAYTRTGEFVDCVDTIRIRNTRVLDNSHIIFEMSGGTHYLNQLPYRCPQLGFHESFSYTLRGLSQLCNVDFITVITSTGLGASCGLGKFEKLEKKVVEE